MKRSLDRASLLHCAQSVGGAQRVLEMTVDYTKQRVQFDRPIASFQSVQHSCADMVIAIDSARLAVYQAITRLEDGEDADKEIALAKTLTNHAYKWTTLTAQQVHGGIAFMEEYDLQLWTRRAKVAELKFGASSGYVEDLRPANGVGVVARRNVSSPCSLQRPRPLPAGRGLIRQLSTPRRPRGPGLARTSLPGPSRPCRSRPAGDRRLS